MGDSGHGNLLNLADIEDDDGSLTNNNKTNNGDSDITNNRHYNSIENDSNSSKSSGCPIYYDTICDEEKNLFKSLQNKLIEMDDFNQKYLNLRKDYLSKKSKIEKDRRINLNLTKQKIKECFNELYILIKERENNLLFELEEIYKSQTIINNNININENNDNNQIQKLVREHMAHLSLKIDHYQSMTNPNMNITNKSTKNILYDLTERKKHILKMGHDIELQHNLKIKYFDSTFNGIKNNIEALKDETHIDFVLDNSIHLDCCNFLKCNEFGNIIANVPKPTINNIQILGNDR